MLFIHGDMIAAAFFPIMDEPALSDYYLIRYHRRGFANSSDPACPYGPEDEAADALALLNHLNVTRTHVVGHSAGGWAALQLASSEPERVQSIVLLEGSYPRIETWEFPDNVRERHERTVVCPAPTDSQNESAEQLQQRLSRNFENWFGDSWLTEMERLIPGGIEQARNDALRHARLRLQYKMDYATEDFFAAINQPVLDVFGEVGMRGSQRETLNQLPNVLPNFETTVVPGIGHEMQMRWPELLADTIAEWLQQHPFD